MKGKNVKFDIIQYDELGGSDNINISEEIFFAKQSVFRSTYSCAREIYLVPSFRHYIIIKLENEELIVDKGIFY